MGFRVEGLGGTIPLGGGYRHGDTAPYRERERERERVCGNRAPGSDGFGPDKPACLCCGVGTEWLAVGKLQALPESHLGSVYPELRDLRVPSHSVGLTWGNPIFPLASCFSLTCVSLLGRMRLTDEVGVTRKKPRLLQGTSGT